jgi:DNA-binding transcriptional MerR regulator
MGDAKTWTISDLAREFGVTTRTIRFYEEKGLLSPARNGQHRIFDRQDHARLELILRGKRAGLSLEESREIIDMYDPEGDNYEQYQFLLGKVDERQIQLESQIEDIKQLITGLQEVRQRCNKALKDIAASQAAKH